MFGYFRLLKVTFSLWTYQNNQIFSRENLSPFDLAFDIPNDIDPVSGIYFPSYPTVKILPKLSLQTGRICYIPTQYRRFYTNLTGTFDEYKNKFSGKSKANLLKKIHKFREFSGGEICWKVYRTSEEARDFCALARTLSLKTYQDKMLYLGFPKTKEFEQHVCMLAAEDNFRGYILFYKAVPIAYSYCPCVNGVVLYHFSGYDPQFREYSVGIVLQYLLLQSLFEEKKFQYFDYAQGEWPHKEFFSTDSVICANIYLFNFTARNFILVGLHLCVTFVASLFITILKKCNFYGKIKKIIRFGF
ncbi:MAG: GNAT family N-acetyltransferase [Legionella sp.]|jgi:hypothetical protein